MKHNISFIKAIKTYLLGKEGPLVRKRLYQMYDALSSNTDYSVQERVAIAEKARLRILNTISQKGKTISQKEKTWKFSFLHSKVTRVAAFVLIFGTTLFLIRMPLFNRNSLQLNSLIPGEDYVALFLPTGEYVNIDGLLLGDSTALGTALVKKDNTGRISCITKLVDGDRHELYVLQTPRSVKAEVILSDGTIVVLNGGSKLHYPQQFGLESRTVILEGEAFFDVRRTVSANCFFVLTDGQCTEVIGTKFNIRAYPNEDEVTTLVEGVVKVSLIEDHKKHIVLAAGQQAIVKAEQIAIKSVDMQPVLGWTNDVFYFNGSNTAEVFEEIARWYGIDIHYQERLYRLPYIGKVPRNLALDNLIQLLTYAEFQVLVRVDKENKTNLIIN